MSEDWQPFAGIEKEEPAPKPIYHDKSNTPTMRWVVGGSIGAVSLVLLITVILIVVQTAKKNPLFSLLLVSLLAFAQLQYFLVFFVYKGKMPMSYVWTIFVVGAFVVIESICTLIVIFTV